MRNPIVSTHVSIAALSINVWCGTVSSAENIPQIVDDTVPHHTLIERAAIDTWVETIG
jgi:hypothetical protein